ncbi:MAG: beta-ketoacyl-ACP synthase II [Chloroflexi bacterium]|nr:beta-ketoacyl-ACP synthase II [Chloroflexota bacterium]MCY3582551.1 beta-ketoacyl-ACP synthase II [Chloroflexota bacterium]MCY3715928.1 beta-ketoacyl-ACP synthase II [Chloroflexota bacterium]MDE2649711.1 beta-ketoacyl-ACP synthase II [Chloroflexota bacterium]MXV92362.1 beta-ketoacyl-ACP synthase II [Chloroflexota bacterium]
MAEKRVVITGMGLVCPVGNNVADSWAKIRAGVSGIDWIRLFDADLVENRVAGEVKDLDLVARFGRRQMRRMDRAQMLALVAAEEALEDAGIVITDDNKYDVGAVVGSGIGGIVTVVQALQGFESKGHRGVSPVIVPALLHDGISSRVSMHFGLKGPNYNITAACATSNNSLGDAADLIRMGRANVMVAGGSEACIMPMVISGFNNMKVLTTTEDIPTKAARPFDATRDGFVAAEGAALLILEDLEHALARGATIHAELTGYGHTSDAFHVTAPNPDGVDAAEAMRRALKEAGISAEQISYINAHGTGTQLNDKSETLAIKHALGDVAYEIPISSTKSMTGHILGATAAAEAIFSIKALHDSFIPPTLNLENPDPECDLDYTPLVGKQAPLQHVLSNSFGFGGHNTAVVLSRYD